MRGRIAALALASIAGCSFATNFDRYDREGPARPADVPDATSADASEDASGAEAQVDAGTSGPNVHPNGTFETGCSDWFIFKSTLEASSVAHTGTGACLVCSVAAEDYYGADDHGSLMSPLLGATYEVHAWVRAAPGKSLPSRSTLTIRTKNEMPFEIVEQDETATVAPNEEWQELTSTLTVTKPAEFLGVAVLSYKQGSPTCFLIDDVTLVRIK